MKNLIYPIMLLAMLLPKIANAQLPGYMFKDGNWTYMIVTDTKVMVTRCQETGTEITVPETATHPTTSKVFTVAYIATNERRIYTETAGPLSANSQTAAEESMSNIAKFSDGAGVFHENLEVLNIPKTVENIENACFYRKLSNSQMTPMVTRYGRILLATSKPVKVNIADDNPYLEVIDDVIYSKDGKALLLYTTIRSSDTYTVQEGVTRIARAAFSRSSQESTDFLTKVVLPSTLIKIDDNAFNYNKKLNDINFPEGLTTIGWDAFAYDESLKSITLPSTLTSIGQSGFSDTGLTSIEVPGGVQTLQKYTFRQCKDLKEVKLNIGTKSIGEYVFVGDSSITSFILPEGLQSIGKCAISACLQLPSITLPSTLKTVGDYAFMCNRDMATVNIPRDITKLGKGIFTCCLNLENITVDEGCTRYQMDNDGGKLDKGVLYGNSDGALNTMDELVFFIPRNNIGDDNKDLIKQWIVPNSVRKICAGSMGENYIESLILPSELTTIEEMAFYREKEFSLAKNAPNYDSDIKEYYKLRELTIPAKVNSIHTSAFFQPFSSSRRSFIKNIFILGTPTFNTESVQFTNKSGQVYSYSSYTYKSKNDDLTIYVKQSNFDNTNFTSLKDAVNNRFATDIPLERSTMTEEGKVSSFCRDFDMDFSNATGVSAYIATEFNNTSDDTRGYKMQQVTYVPSRTGTDNDEYHGVILRMEDPTATITYRIGEEDYNSGSQNVPEAFASNKLVGVVANSHVQGTEGEGADMMTNWGLSNGKWQKIVNRGKLTPYNRAYLQTDATETAVMTGGSSNAKISMFFPDEDNTATTGITTINNGEQSVDDDVWFTIDGVRLKGRPTQKGLYIRNGRKEVVR